MGGPRWRVPVAPQARGHVPRRVLEHLGMTGWTVHRVGRAAYVHRGDLHLLLGVWDRRDPPPPWAGRLGRVSDGYVRRAERCDRRQHARTMLRDAAGRFAARLPWWRWPGPRIYSWQPAAPSLYELERGRP